MTRKLIVNADGFGFGPGATQGVFDALEEGSFITSISVNANFPEAERISEISSDHPNISIGLHLNPMVGKPCLPPRKVLSLIGQDGYFHGNKFPHLLRNKLISFTELEAEFDAQISKVKELVGDQLTHLDSQANKHLMYFDLFLKVAHKWGIQRMRTNAPVICLESANPFKAQINAYVRRPHIFLVHQYRKYQMRKARESGMRMADSLITVGYAGSGNKTNIDNWRRILKNLPEGTFEIYCHPAYPDETLNRWASYNKEREQELKILARKALADAASEAGVRLISFHDI